MDEAQRKHVAITAHMEGKSVVARNTGKKHKVSEFELVTLCNLAEIGMLTVFAGLDGEMGDNAANCAEKQADVIRESMQSADGKRDGLMVLTEACAAILRSDRFSRYILQPK
jgi:hypothetical protein